MNFDEFNKLVDMMTEAHIPFQIIKCRECHMVLRYPCIQKSKLSVALGPITYGHKEGLLETWSLKRKDEPAGWLTAQNVFKRILSIEAKEE